MAKTISRFALLLALAGALLASNVACPIDGSASPWDGKTTIDKPTGKMLYEHKCLSHQHTFWTLSM